MWERLQFEERFQFVPAGLVVHVIVDHLGDDLNKKLQNQDLMSLNFIQRTVECKMAQGLQ